MRSERRGNGVSSRKKKGETGEKLKPIKISDP